MPARSASQRRETPTQARAVENQVLESSKTISCRLVLRKHLVAKTNTFYIYIKKEHA
jgi:hypothetical protein